MVPSSRAADAEFGEFIFMFSPRGIASRAWVSRGALLPPPQAASVAQRMRAAILVRRMFGLRDLRRGSAATDPDPPEEWKTTGRALSFGPFAHGLEVG